MPRVHFTKLGQSEQTKEIVICVVFVYMCLCAFVSDISIIILFKIINNDLPPSWLSAIIGDGKQVFFKSWP